jgi:hypothetical protein
VERFLTNAVKYTVDLTLNNAITLAGMIKIVHMYGSLPTRQPEAVIYWLI